MVDNRCPPSINLCLNRLHQGGVVIETGTLPRLEMLDHIARVITNLPFIDSIDFLVKKLMLFTFLFGQICKLTLK
jgi:hypothetical protein